MLPWEIVILLLYYLFIVDFLPSKSMTIGLRLDSSRTASFDGSAAVVEAVVEAVVVLTAGVVGKSLHSYDSQGHPALQFS